MMNKEREEMLQKVENTIQKYNLIQIGDKIVLGVSGGPDSITMLDILNKLKQKLNFEIVVAHLNHMIRKEAIEDEKYVEQYCKKNQIKFYLKRIDAKQYADANKLGLEEAGRILRYNFFDEIMKNTGSNKIGIAHNKNDKVETILMNIMRGAGLNGIKGIEPIRENKYIRPLIECERQEIEIYCQKKDLNPRIDKTNFINDCTRNKVRNIVLPYIKKEFNPNFIETINRLSEVVAETDKYLNRQTMEEFEKLVLKENNKQIVLDLKQFNKKEHLIKNRIVIYTIAKLLGKTNNIEKVNIEDIVMLCQNNIGNKYLMPNKNIKVSINKGKIFFEVIK